MRTVYLHIGLHKTATSWLQQYFFPKLAEQGFIYNPPEIMRLIPGAVIGSPEAIAEIRAHVEGYDQNLIVSSELMAGNPFLLYGNFEKSLDHMLAAFGTAHILLTIRNQVDFIQSLYRQSLHKGSKLDFRQFLGLKPNVYGHSLDPYALDYEKMLSVLNDKFGAQNKTVLFFETFKSSPLNFLETLCVVMNANSVEIEQIGKPRNRGFSALACILTPFVAKIFRIQEPDKVDIFAPIHEPERLEFLKRYNLPEFKQRPVMQIIAQEPLKNGMLAIRGRFAVYLWAWLNRPMKMWRIFIQKYFDNMIYIDWDLYDRKTKEALAKHYSEKNKSLAGRLPELPGSYCEINS